jgi:hypothetical protein
MLATQAGSLLVRRDGRQTIGHGNDADRAVGNALATFGTALLGYNEI